MFVEKELELVTPEEDVATEEGVVADDEETEDEVVGVMPLVVELSLVMTIAVVVSGLAGLYLNTISSDIAPTKRIDTTIDTRTTLEFNLR